MSRPFNFNLWFKLNHDGSADVVLPSYECVIVVCVCVWVCVCATVFVAVSQPVCLLQCVWRRQRVCGRVAVSLCQRRRRLPVSQCCYM